MIHKVQLNDAEEICAIYNYYIENTIITFEETPVTISEMQNRIKRVTESYPWFVFKESGVTAGYAYAGIWKVRSAYKYCVESTVYVSNQKTGNGIGSILYKELIKELKKLNLHSVLAGIALPNPSSVALHEKFGFIKTAHFRETGWKLDKWIDVGYWELLLAD
jgi:L-amino acid N-acyltransferase YncA